MIPARDETLSPEAHPAAIPAHEDDWRKAFSQGMMTPEIPVNPGICPSRLHKVVTLNAET